MYKDHYLFKEKIYFIFSLILIFKIKASGTEKGE